MGTMYLTATLCSFFAPSVISHFPSERRALASFAFEFWSFYLLVIMYSLFVGSFAFNYPALILTCSVIHGFSLAVELMESVNVVFLGVSRSLFGAC